MKAIISLILSLFIYTGTYGQDDFDRIFLLNRTEIKAKISEIRTFEIEYYELGAPEVKKSIRISAVWKIVKASGDEQEYNRPLPLDIVEKSEAEEEVEENVGTVIPANAGKDSTFSYPSKKNKFNFDEINFYVDNRPIYAIRVGFGPHIITEEKPWVSTIPSDGLGFRFGASVDLGLEFNFHQLFGISLTSGFSTANSSLAYLEGKSELSDEKLKLSTIPTAFKVKFYPMDGLSISGGTVFNKLTLSSAQPLIDKSSKTGYTFGFSRLAPIGRSKNLFEIGMNYTKVGLNTPVEFKVDSTADGSSLLGPFTLDKFGYVTIILAYQFGIFNK